MGKSLIFGSTTEFAKKRKAIAPSRGQSNLLGGQRATLEEAIEYTRMSLCDYLERFPVVILNFSGGKDSTVLYQLYAHFRRTGQIPAVKHELVLMSDTRMELLPLAVSARRLLNTGGLPYRIVQPELRLDAPRYTERFFVYMFGVGVPPPNSKKMRWCTRKLKAEPMERVRTELAARYGNENILNLTGVRRGESAVRDQAISAACSRDDGECGQGVFQNSPTGFSLAPIDQWRLCHVEDWLTFYAKQYGFGNDELCVVYGFDQDEQTAATTGMRTGCMACPLVEEDRALNYISTHAEWSYLAPVARLKVLYEELRKPQYRLRKNGERNSDGRLSANPNRMGPLTMEARRFGVRAVLSIQDAVNEAAQGRPRIELLSEEEVAYIKDLHALNVWPQGWGGTEKNANELREYVVDEGVTQPLLGLEGL